MMYVPLNAVIVTEVYKTSRESPDKFIPTTMTELYTALTRGILLRYLHSHTTENMPVQNHTRLMHWYSRKTSFGKSAKEESLTGMSVCRYVGPYKILNILPKGVVVADFQLL